MLIGTLSTLPKAIRTLNDPPFVELSGLGPSITVT